MSNRFIIPGKLPGLNELIGKNRSSKWTGARMKSETDTAICWTIKKAMDAGECRKPSGPVRIRFDWHESTRRRDLDNVFSAKKFILDAMQRMKVIDNDDQRHVVGLCDFFHLDEHEHIVVTLEEAGPDG